MDAQKAVLLADLESSKDFELDGASTLNAWVRTQLRMNSGQASTLVKNVAALRDLPLLAEAALTGQVSSAHVRVFVYGLAHVGLEPMRQFEDVFVEVAQELRPTNCSKRSSISRTRSTPKIWTPRGNEAWTAKTSAVDAVPDGFHVSGFLNTVTGSKLKKVLDSVSAPRDKEDTRTGSERRVQGLDDLLTSVLANGLPSDKGVRPHMSVFVDADTLQAAAEHVQATDRAAAPDPRTDATS